MLEEGWSQVRHHGWIGDADPATHIEHSLAMLDWTTRWLAGWEGRRAADLGSGAGIPGLVWALALPDSTTLHLVERSRRRAAFLRLMTARLSLGPRVRVWDEPAETVGLGGDAGRLEVVVARSFGPPRVVAAVAERLLGPEGVLVVSGPPGSGGDRWEDDVVEARGWVVLGARHHPAVVALTRRAPAQPNAAT